VQYNCVYGHGFNTKGVSEVFCGKDEAGDSESNNCSDSFYYFEYRVTDFYPRLSKKLELTH